MRARLYIVAVVLGLLLGQTYVALSDVTVTPSRTVLTPNSVCLDAANRDACLTRSAANILKVATSSSGATAATLYAAKLTTTGAGTFSGVTMAAGEKVAVVNGGGMTFTTNTNGRIDFQPNASTNQMTATSGSDTALINTTSILPASGSASFALIHLNPTINGTSSGTAYGIGIASVTNTLTGGAIKLFSAGTTTTDLFTGYTARADIDTTGLTRSTLYGSMTNCASSASPAVCAAAPAGSVVIAATATSVVVNTTAVTANSQIFAMIDSSLGTRLSVTCDTTSDLTTGSPTITTRTAATSFTIAVPTAPAVNPMCLSYFIVN